MAINKALQTAAQKVLSKVLHKGCWTDNAK